MPQLPGITFVEIAVGKSFLVARCEAGNLYSMGHYGFGQLGYVKKKVSYDVYNGKFTQSLEQIPITSVEFSTVSCAHYTTIAVSDSMGSATFSADLYRAFQLEDFYDVSFELGTKSLNAHKAIFYSRAPKFYEKFLAATQQTKDAIDRISLQSPFEFEVFHEFVKWLYYDQTDIDSKLMEKLIWIADEFNLPNLSSICQQKVMHIPKSTQRHDIRSLFNKNLFSDIILVAGTGLNTKKFYCHKFILTSRCDYFRTMFLSAMKESRATEITTGDITPEVLNIILEYIYSEELMFTSDTIVEVLITSNQYRLDHLKQQCEKEIGANLDEENVLMLLQIAEQYNCPVLRRRTLRYIELNIEKVKKAKDFSTAPVEILRQLLANGIKL